MKKLILTSLFSLASFANNCSNLEAIADTFKSDLKAELEKTFYPEDTQGQEQFRVKVGQKLDYLKSLKHQVDVCYQDYQMEDEVYNCSLSADLLKSRHPGGLTTSYTNALSTDGDCMAYLFLSHTMTRNSSGKVILKSLGGKFEINTLYKCHGHYTNEENSFRKMILSGDNFFVMDQYMIYRTDVKVLGKKYVTQNLLAVKYMDEEIAFNYGAAELVISTKDGSVTRTNFLSMDEVSEGKCQTAFSAKNNSIYPRTNIDEARWGFRLEYVSY
ncbi:hypothetical protein ABMA75_03815 [Halobacteriovorax sp. ZH4_bin.1]|uniref:hypothetical protein n=1 Tax=unclassified Halobacteriovorax TaxID=2639665 RepID=UPI0037159641